MTMKPALVLVLGLVLTATFVVAQAQTYQWKDSNGRTVISDTPPPGSAKSKRTLGAPPSGTVSSDEKAPEKTAEAPKSYTEKDLEFKKRQQEAKEKAEKDTKDQKLAADKRDNCERAQRNLTALESKQPVASFNEKGESVQLDDTQRTQEIERARQILAESCK